MRRTIAPARGPAAPRRRNLSAAAATATAAVGLVLGTAVVAQAFDPAVGINTGGGTNASDGLAVQYGSGQIQVQREGDGQVYGSWLSPGATTVAGLYNGVYLVVGDTAIGPDHGMIFGPEGGVAQFVEWDTITAGGGSTGPGSIVSVLTWTDPVTTLAYEVELTLGYASATDDFYTETAQLTVPMGNAEPVKLYRAVDTMLGGVDTGAGFYRGGTHPLVGVIADDRTVVEAFRHVSGPAWTGYFSGAFWCMYGTDPACVDGGGFINSGLDLPAGSAAIDPDSTTDNGIGINWDLAAVAGQPTGATAPGGVTTFAYDLFFTADASVAGSAQTITLAPVDAPLSHGTVALPATSSAGLPIAYRSADPSVCTVSGSVVTLVALGSCDLVATQGGDDTYAPASTVAASFDVTPDGTTPQTVTFPAPPASGTVGTPVGLTATSDSGLAVTYVSTTTGVCTVSGSTVTLLSAGTCTVEARQIGDSTYAAAIPVSRTFTVTASAGSGGAGGATGSATGSGVGSSAPSGTGATPAGRRSAPTDGLAVTGVELAGMVTLGTALVGGGAGLAWTARRRSRVRTGPTGPAAA